MNKALLIVCNLRAVTLHCFLIVVIKVIESAGDYYAQDEQNVLSYAESIFVDAGEFAVIVIDKTPDKKDEEKAKIVIKPEDKSEIALKIASHTYLN